MQQNPRPSSLLMQVSSGTRQAQNSNSKILFGLTEKKKGSEGEQQEAKYFDLDYLSTGSRPLGRNINCATQERLPV